MRFKQALFGADPVSLHPDRLVAYNVAALPTCPSATLIETRAAGAEPINVLMARQLRYVQACSPTSTR